MCSAVGRGRNSKRLGESGGCSSVVTLFFPRSLRTYKDKCARALSCNNILGHVGLCYVSSDAVFTIIAIQTVRAMCLISPGMDSDAK